MLPHLPIYLDHHSTTPCDPRVVEAMLPYFTDQFGNAASRNHVFGWKSAEAVEQAREQVARLIGAEPKEIIFTSGATESDNLAIKGAASMYARHGKHLVTTVIEHHAVLDVGKRLQRNGWDISFLPVDHHGKIAVEQVAAALRPDTVLASVMFANNEVGTIQPLADLGRLCKDRGVLLHTDAAQAVGKIPVDVEALGVDLLSISAHKMYGPKGVGALYVRRRDPAVRLEPLFDGGGHERGMRPGTLPVPLIVGLGKAADLAREEMIGEQSARSPFTRSTPRRLGVACAGLHLEWASCGAASGKPQSQLSRSPRRGAADVPQADRREFGIGVYVGERRAKLCAAGPRRVR